MIADQAKQILKLENISCIIQSPDIGIGGMGGSVLLPQGADLYVQEEYFKKAQELLVNIFNGI